VNARETRIEEELEALLDRAERTPRRLGFDDLRRLARLYRLGSARLAVLRSRRRSDPEAVRYLNALCVRAYTHLQVAPRRARSTGRFFLVEFPATLAATARLQMLAAIVMLAGGLAGATLVAENPAALYACIPARMYPPDLLEGLVTSAAQRADFLAHKQVAFGLKSVFSASLFVHNTQVGLLAFASGILAGLPTLILDFYNGLTLGAFVWIFSRDRAWPLFWAWLLPHAIPGLLAVILCSAGGLVLAKGVKVALHDQRPPRERGMTLRDYVLSGARDLVRLPPPQSRAFSASQRFRPARASPPRRSRSAQSSATCGMCGG